jgi:hypothetical protein
MALRRLSRWFLWITCVFAAFFCARTAEASAPMCDARGMSVDAPPPVLPIRDARIDGMSPPLCHDAAVFFDIGRQVRRGASTVTAGTVDAWLQTKNGSLPPNGAAHALEIVDRGLTRAPGHDTGVFRPPRAA